MDILEENGAVFGQKTQLWWNLPVIEIIYLMSILIICKIVNKEIKTYLEWRGLEK